MRPFRKAGEAVLTTDFPQDAAQAVLDPSRRPSALRTQHPFRLLHVAVPIEHRLLSPMRPKSSEERLNTNELGMVIKPGPKLKIGGHAQRAVQSSPGAFPQRPPPERRFLLNPSPAVRTLRREVAATNERLPVESARKVDGHRLTARIPADGMDTGQPFDLRKCRENICHDGQRPRHIPVVTVQPGHD